MKILRSGKLSEPKKVIFSPTIYIINIDQIITVQTCFFEEKAPEVVKEEAPLKPTVAPVQPKAKSDFFVLISGQLNKSGNGDGNRSSHGQGIKLEVGKYFKLSEDQKIKASAGVLYNETSLENVNEKTKKTTGTADVSYLFKINEKMSLGPDVGIFTSSGFGDAQKVLDDKVAGFVGANLDYQLNDRFHLDLKVVNELESRVNLNTTFGLGINF